MNDTNENNLNNMEVKNNTNEELEKTFIDNAQYTVNDNDYSYNPPPKKKKKKKRGVGPYIAIGLICSTLGGGIGGAVTYTALRHNNQSPTVQEKSNNNVSTTPISAGDYMNIPDVVQKVSPAVVGVATKSFPKNFAGWQTSPQEGIGSGFIFNEEGLILTNYHVVEGASEVNVILSTGEEVSAKVVNYNEDADLAVVKITKKDVKIPGVLTFGNSDDIKVGEQVIAIGSPLSKDFSGSVTTGIISAVNREMQFENGKTLKLIQTDTAINPGNSGGPLLNSKGEVVGINTAKIQAQGVEGLGFSIPINAAKEKLDILTKPILKLGIQCKDIDEALSKQYNIPQGIYIAGVEDFSAAQKAGIQPGDVIVKFDGKDVKTVAEINALKEKHEENDTVPVEYIRDGKTMKANIKLEA
ncbi:S1C family serine protease [Clostridium senegalense]|uniref:S1C family serine protease n=1 Tax=Clostridium senegalense TaxID=1465809 RepID=UPI000287EDF4|nr:trypsin-like peptidase domain-containing protein [Clostridium senegalense]